MWRGEKWLTGITIMTISATTRSSAPFLLDDIVDHNYCTFSCKMFGNRDTDIYREQKQLR
ncbi:hypothetical protein [Nostoc sp.]|uniref:hypothetical protein n=1 Tax=Nostoc sp. TaxID=1180 RepID=UPI002FF71274